jgi:hypothetical protein
MPDVTHRSTPTEVTMFEGLPGWEIVGPGLDDLANGRQTIAAELVSSASDALRQRGLIVAGSPPSDGESLYRLIVADVGEPRAHGRYNALRRRLASFLRASARARAG